MTFSQKLLYLFLYVLAYCLPTFLGKRLTYIHTYIHIASDCFALFCETCWHDVAFVFIYCTPVINKKCIQNFRLKASRDTLGYLDVKTEFLDQMSNCRPFKNDSPLCSCNIIIRFSYLHRTIF